MAKKLNDKLKKQVQRVFAEAGRKILNYKQVARRLEIDSTEGKNDVLLVMKQLAKDKIIEEIDAGRYVTIFVHEFVTGRVDMTQHGTAYVVREDGQEDVFIASEFKNTALNGDKVKVSLFAHHVNGKQTGEIIEVLERSKSQFVGVVQVHYNYAFLIPDDKKMHINIFIPKEKIGSAKQGDKAIARITEWTAEEENPFGEIIEVLGRPGAHETEMNAIVVEYGFANRFPAEVEKEADKIPEKIAAEEIKKRKDFRKTLTFTIDPEDAKDFDDALSFKVLSEGLYEIGIHIADVSHYIPENSQLDVEALKRATSVYLVDRTIPMLPEKLSNGVCSLRPNEDKLTFSVVVHMNSKAEVLDTWFGKTVIHSQRRFTYEEAQVRLETKEGDLANELNIMNDLAKVLKEKRFKKGAISFETQEVKFKLDENFKPIDLFVKIRKDAHKLIEEFMLLANRKVAEFGFNLGKGENKKTFVYRIHEQPNEDKIRMFNIFAARFGHKIEMQSQKSIAQSFNQLLEDVEGKPEQNLIQSQAIRTMSKAYYGCKKSMHYGLAFDHYTHFTSPIRRYPDLMVHRLLFNYLNKGVNANEAHYESMSKQSSQMEVKAAEAERASVRFKQVEYISGFIGDEFDGIISGVTEWGIYVEISQYKCEGMLRLNNMGDDFYDYDEANQWIIGRRNRKKYQVGDPIRVIVAAADIFKRQIDLHLVDDGVKREFKRGWEKEKKRRDKPAKGKNKGRRR
ncbi:MAG: ribonuclease R [Bacteroidetes bacterium B1(2017)]|nr:MAG: ribonuclease R [Bacteroidetes bacterium B1(2017)]